MNVRAYTCTQGELILRKTVYFILDFKMLLKHFNTDKTQYHLRLN